MSFNTDLEEIRDNWIGVLKDLSLNPKPSYSVGNRSWSWTEYQAMARKEIDALNDMISKNSPYMVSTRVVV